MKHLDCFQIEAITNNMAMEILGQKFFVCSCIHFYSVCALNFSVHRTYLYSTSMITATQCSFFFNVFFDDFFNLFLFVGG